MEEKEVHSFSFRNIFIDTVPLLSREGVERNRENDREREVGLAHCGRKS